VKRGEVWWASLSEPGGSDPVYRRPVLVVQADTFNRSRIRTVICAAITSNLRLEAAPGNLRLSSRTSGLKKASVVNVSQLITTDRDRLTEKIKRLDPRTMRRVEEGLRLVLEL